jgi:RNA polymerase sigma factor (sigma-70 family)
VEAGETWRRDLAGEMLAGVESREDIGAFYAREMERLVMFVKSTSTSLDWHAAGDVAQTAFERALPRWSSLTYPKAWLYKVAYREALARCAVLDRESPVDTMPDRADQVSAEQAAEWRDSQRRLWELVAGLPPKQRAVMAWTVGGFADAEIASVLELSTDAVKANRRYARKTLQKRLRSGWEDER